MRIAYFDGFSGASGDMILGALVDAGLPVDELQAALHLLRLPGLGVKVTKVRRGDFVGTRVDILVPEESGRHRDLAEIIEIISQSGLDQAVKEEAKRVFHRLAQAEAKVHGASPDELSFHEVGALDTIADVVGAVFGTRRLGIEKVCCSPLNLGSGFVGGAHGRVPIPAPGTLELLRGVPTYSSGIGAELVTPTGAAILSTLASRFGPLPSLTIRAIGYGAGTLDLEEQPNLLRLILGEGEEATEEDRIAILEANIDDMSPQLFEPLMEQLFQKGALDVSLTPIIMKKSRPAVRLTVLTDVHLTNTLSAVILAESTTFGVRIVEARRKRVKREVKEVQTRFGPIRVKCGFLGETLYTLSPEYEDCRRVASSGGIPTLEVYEEAKRAADAQIRQKSPEESIGQEETVPDSHGFRGF